MSFDSTTLKNGIYNWVTTIVPGVPCVWEYQNAPAPTLPYIGLNIARVSSIGMDFEDEPDNNGNTSIWGNRELLLQLNYFGSGSLNAMEALYTSLRTEPTLDILHAAGLVYVNKMLQTNVVTLINSNYEERQLLELIFRYSNQGITAASTYNVGLIEHVTGTGSVEADRQGNPISVPFKAN